MLPSDFYARTSYRNSVCLSVGLSWPCTDSSPSEIKTIAYVFLRCDSVQSLVCCEQMSCRWVKRSPQRRRQREVPLWNRYFTAINSSSMRTVADRHRLAAYHNKHCWRTFRGYQLRWPWTTLNPKNKRFGEFFVISRCNTHFKRELRRNHWRYTKTTCVRNVQH